MIKNKDQECKINVYNKNYIKKNRYTISNSVSKYFDTETIRNDAVDAKWTIEEKDTKRHKTLINFVFTTLNGLFKKLN